jgi:hypothetical protein
MPSWKEYKAANPSLKPGVVTGDAAWAILKYAKETGFAIPAFNCVSTGSCNSVLEAAAKLDRPIMIQFSEGGAAFFAGKSLPNKNKEASVLGAVAGAHYVRSARHRRCLYASLLRLPLTRSRLWQWSRRRTV